MLIVFAGIKSSKAQITYDRPEYSINAGLDSTFCSSACATIKRTAIPQHENRTTNSYKVQLLTMPSPTYNTTGSNIIVNQDDVWSDVLNIGFNFCYFGNTYNQVVIGANGMVSFNTTYANTYCPWSYTGGIPDATKPTNTIMGPYTDIDPSIGYNPNRINYYTEGTAPCRRFVINFNRVPMFGSSCNGLLLTSQIILHEAYNIIDIIISNKPVCSNWNGGRGIIGIQNAAGNIAYSAPGNNPSTTSINSQCWRFLPDGAIMQSINWTQNGIIVSNNDILTTSICPTSTTNFVANLVNTRCDGTSVTVKDNVNFTINQLPIANAGANKIIGCLIPTVTIGTPAVPGHTYTWSPAAKVNNAYIAQPTTNTPGVYILTVKNTATNCTATSTVTVTSNNTTPVANAGSNKTLTCSGVILGVPAIT